MRFGILCAAARRCISPFAKSVPTRHCLPTPSLADPLDARRIRFAEHVMRPGIEIRKVVGTRHGVISKAAREQLPGFGVEHDMFE